MLTPAFDLTQDDNFLIASIHIPYTKASEAEVDFEDYDFKFYCKPYFLRLKLPGKVVCCNELSVTHNIDTGIMVIKIPKAIPGEMFEDLELITKLFAPKAQCPSSSVPKIEIIGDVSCPDVDKEDFNWEIEQPIEESILPSNANCGFANIHSCAVFRYKEEMAEILDIMNPETKSPKIRTEERLQAETNYFSDEHYLADLYLDDEDYKERFQQILAFIPESQNLSTCVHSSTANNSSQNGNFKFHFTSEEKERMRRLPNKEYLLEKLEVKTALLGLIDILFAYAYNVRTTEGDNTVESAWTINKLSATLSCLETFTSVPDVARNFMRRSLCYSSCRNWELAKTVVNDTIKILLLGQKYVLRCFLEIHQLFCESEPRSLLNDLYITDYCVWIQSKSCRSRVLHSLAKALEKAIPSKEDMGLDLEVLELAGQFAVQDHKVCSAPCTSRDRLHSSSSESSTDEDTTGESSVTGSDYADSSSSDNSESDFQSFRIS